MALASLILSACQLEPSAEDRIADGDPASLRASAAIDLLAGIPQRRMALGSPTARVILTDFTDLQCPFCRRFFTSVLPTLVERYVRPGKLAIIFGDLPILGKGSDRAAQFTAAAGLQGRAWDFVVHFMENQGREGSGYVTDTFLTHLASDIPGLDTNRVLSDADSDEVHRIIHDYADQATRFHVRGTPTFLLGRTGEDPKVLRINSSDVDAFTRAIDELTK